MWHPPPPPHGQQPPLDSLKPWPGRWISLIAHPPPWRRMGDQRDPSTWPVHSRAGQATCVRGDQATEKAESLERARAGATPKGQDATPYASQAVRAGLTGSRRRGSRRPGGRQTKTCRRRRGRSRASTAHQRAGSPQPQSGSWQQCPASLPGHSKGRQQGSKRGRRQQ